MVLIVHDLDLFEQFLVRHLPRTGRSFAPNVVAAGRHRQFLAHPGDRELVPVVFDELESHLVFVYRVMRARWDESKPRLWSQRLSWAVTGLH